MEFVLICHRCRCAPADGAPFQFRPRSRETLTLCVAEPAAECHRPRQPFTVAATAGGIVRRANLKETSHADRNPAPRRLHPVRARRDPSHVERIIHPRWPCLRSGFNAGPAAVKATLAIVGGMFALTIGYELTQIARAYIGNRR